MDLPAFTEWVNKHRNNDKVLYGIAIFYKLHLRTSPKDLLGCGYKEHRLHFELEDVC